MHAATKYEAALTEDNETRPECVHPLVRSNSVSGVVFSSDGRATKAKRIQMLVKSILTKPATVVAPDTSVASVSKVMRGNNSGAVLVLHGQTLVGIVTDRDVVKCLAATGSQICHQPVSSVMTPDPLTCYSDQRIEDAAIIMADHQMRRLPVVNHSGDVVGLLTLDLIAENFSEHLAGEVLGEIVERRSDRRKRDPV